MDYREEIIAAKYHLNVCFRMVDLYEKYAEKRVLIGIINEGAKAAGKLIRSFLIFDKTHGNIRTFIDKVGVKYLDNEKIEHIVKMLEVERAQKKSPIEFARGDKIILLIGGKYRILKVDRLLEFVNSIKEGISIFDKACRQV